MKLTIEHGRTTRELRGPLNITGTVRDLLDLSDNIFAAVESLEDDDMTVTVEVPSMSKQPKLAEIPEPWDGAQVATADGEPDRHENGEGHPPVEAGSNGWGVNLECCQKPYIAMRAATSSDWPEFMSARGWSPDPVYAVRYRSKTDVSKHVLGAVPVLFTPVFRAIQ